MNREFERSELIIGQEALKKLADKHVAVFGVGGVGGFVVEALARTGIGQLTLIDKDNVDITNINRQIIALHSTIGLGKVQVMGARVLDINPRCKVNEIQKFFLPDNSNEFDFSQYDYIVDAVDTVTAKIQLIVQAKALDIPIISSMGMGNKMDPLQIKVGDIYETSICPLAKVIRRKLRQEQIDKVKVVFSTEEPLRLRPPGSISFVPSVAGMVIASQIVKEVLES